MAEVKMVVAQDIDQFAVAFVQLGPSIGLHHLLRVLVQFGSHGVPSLRTWLQPVFEGYVEYDFSVSAVFPIVDEVSHVKDPVLAHDSLQLQQLLSFETQQQRIGVNQVSRVDELKVEVFLQHNLSAKIAQHLLLDLFWLVLDGHQSTCLQPQHMVTLSKVHIDRVASLPDLAAVHV